jgi:GNAT superfamily N-acetyltransferase
MRCNGLGSLLFNRLIEECKDKKFYGIVWQVLEWNEPAIKFYKKYKADFDGEWVNCSITL